MGIRRVESSQEIATVERLAREIWTEHYTPIIGRGQVDYMLDRYQSAAAIAGQLASGCEYYLLEHAGQPAGYLAVAPDPDPACLLLSKIYVRQALRGLGLGKALLAFAEERGRELGVRTLWLTVNKHNASSIAWYERAGFRQAGPLVTDIGGGYLMDDWRMEKTLPATP